MEVENMDDRRGSLGMLWYLGDRNGTCSLSNQIPLHERIVVRSTLVIGMAPRSPIEPGMPQLRSLVGTFSYRNAKKF